MALAVAIAATACGGGSKPAADVVARGERLYATSCLQCHGGPTGGAISDIPPRHGAQGHTWHHADCLLTDIVLDGLPPRPGVPDEQIMPAFRDQLIDAEVDAILTYLKTWWTDEQREAQAEMTAAECGGN